MSRLILALLLFVLMSCANIQRGQLSDLPLPSQSAGHCCWQALQQLNIVRDGNTLSLQGVIAVTEKGLTLVLLDPLGRKLLSVKHQPPQRPEVYQSPELTQTLPSDFLLKSVYFSWWPSVDWPELEDSGWRLSQESTTRRLYYGNTEILSAEYFSESGELGTMTPANITSTHLRHSQEPISITIRTEQWQAL